MKTVIEKLKNDLKPKRALPLPEWRFSLWLLTAIVIIFSSIHNFGPRHDLSNQLLHFQFWIEIIIMITLLITGGLTAFYLAIPGEKPSRLRPLTQWLNIALIANVIMWFIPSITRHHPLGFDMNYTCGIITFVTSLIPIVLITAAILRSAPLHKNAAIRSAVTSGSLAGLLAIHIICNQNDAGHLFTWHFLPFIGLAGISWLIAKWIYK